MLALFAIIFAGEADCLSDSCPNPAHCDSSPTIAKSSGSAGARLGDLGKEPSARTDAVGLYYAWENCEVSLNRILGLA